MVRCVVSRCPNRTNSLQGNRAPKTFFSFPSDPIRVKVWLAALRETDKLDSTVKHLICEDHFLKEDITSNGVKSDAIPIVSPYLDGSISAMSSWEAETRKEEEEEEEEEEEDEDVYVVVDDDPAPTEPPKPEPPAWDPPPELHPSPTISSPPKVRSGVSLPLRFLQLLQTLPGVEVEVKNLAKMLQADRRRVCDISSVLEGINLVERQKNRIKWIGGSDHSPPPALHSLQSETENLGLMEEKLDGLIRDVFLQLLDMSSNTQNAELAYVTLDDIRRLEAFEEQTLLVVKAPDETVLKVPEPLEDVIQIHVRSWKGPVAVLTCDTGSKDSTAERKVGFSSLEDSRVKMSALHRDVNSSPPVFPIDVASSGDASTS